MAEKMVEVVIKIPETIKTNINNGHFWGSATIFEAIQRGTIIPKGHGRLIDADTYRKEMLDSREFDFFKRLDMQPTIIDADKDGDTDG